MIHNKIKNENIFIIITVCSFRVERFSSLLWLFLFGVFFLFNFLHDMAIRHSITQIRMDYVVHLATKLDLNVLIHARAYTHLFFASFQFLMLTLTHGVCVLCTTN